LTNVRAKVPFINKVDRLTAKNKDKGSKKFLKKRKTTAEKTKTGNCGRGCASGARRKPKEEKSLGGSSTEMA